MGIALCRVVADFGGVGVRTMNSRELARQVGDITPDELCRLARKRKIPARKRKGLWRFNESSLMALREHLSQPRR